MFVWNITVIIFVSVIYSSTMKNFVRMYDAAEKNADKIGYSTINIYFLFNYHYYYVYIIKSDSLKSNL